MAAIASDLLRTRAARERAFGQFRCARLASQGSRPALYCAAQNAI